MGDLVQYLSSSTFDQIDEQCLDLVAHNIFREVTCNRRMGWEQRMHRMSHSQSEPDGGVRTFRFASLLLQHVASNLVLEVQKQQILRKMKTQAHRRTSYNIHLENLNTQYV